ncbi:MAG: biotin-dependent carboxyltransferase family protein [Vicinamibacterales bacterium]
MDAIEVIDGGFFTTVQDLGRYGYQRYGVPVSGAMDLFALRAANLLVGNPRSAAALEVTLTGPRLRFLTDAVIAVAGADMEPRLDDWPVPMWRPVAASEGAVLAFGATRGGLRAYLAVVGGIDVPVVLGSRSTFPRAGLGGFQGRPIRVGDVLATCGDPLARVEGRRFPTEQIPTYTHHHTIRVILGPQDDAFTAEGLSTFFSATYMVTPKSDRIGCRLDGPPVPHKGSPDIISDGVPFGAVQIAGDGFPMVLAADRGTTGGYAKLATVISADLPRLAQALPGDRVTFRAVSLDEAHRAVDEEEAVLDRLLRSSPIVFVRRRLEVRVDDAVYAVALGLHEQAAGEMTVETVERDVQAIGDGMAATMKVTIAEARDSHR